MNDDQLDNIPARIAAAAAALHGTPKATAEQKATACSVLRDMLAGAAQHGLTLADFDALVDLPGAAIHAVIAKDRAKHWYGQ